MRIPIAIAHAVDPKRKQPMTLDRYETYFRIAKERGFQSIVYDQLEAWMQKGGSLPARPIMFDFDHPERSLYREIWPIMRAQGYRGSLFINTGQMETLYAEGGHRSPDRTTMTWEEIGELAEAGWTIGAHTHTHPNLCDLCMEDPSGDKVRWEFDTCDALLREMLGLVPPAFAWTGETFHSLAEVEVKKRYRFARLWITGQVYWADGRLQKVQDLIGILGPDEADGGPPIAARYITADSNPYRLPSMGLGYLAYDFDAFRRYLDGALEG